MSGRKYFLNAREGAFSEKPEEGKQTQAFEELTGHLVNVTFKETHSGECLRLYIVNEQDFYIVSMFVNSRQANAFMLLAKNLDLHSEMKFIMRMRDFRTFFSIHQNGGPVKWYYGKENAHELPVFADDKRAFLKKQMEEEFFPALQKKMNPFPSHLLYSPAGSGLRGGYFDDFKNEGRLVRPVGRHERQSKKVYGNSRPLN